MTQSSVLSSPTSVVPPFPAQSPVLSTHYIEGRTGPWEIIIGLEIHAQIATNSKLFSGSAREGDEGANSRVNFFDAGMPGMLPVVNSACIDQAIRTGLGIHGTINPVSVFDRKNYFYADLPAGYQISQFFYPLVTGGYVDIIAEDESVRIGVTRIHIEQDAGKSIHDLDPERSLIDLNRSGIGLMELVTEPDMRSVAQAVAMAKKVHSLVQYLGTCEGNMEKGHFRIDANISVHRPGTPFGTRAEIKNLNSFRFMQAALEYEVERQITLIEDGETVTQETRLYDANQGVTNTMRDKEDANDYRYFPDPDLPPLILKPERIEALRQALPELPDAKKVRFKAELGLSEYDAEILSGDREVGQFYDEAIADAELKTAGDWKAGCKLVANWIIGELFAVMKERAVTIREVGIPPHAIAQLVALIQKGVISGKIAKTVFETLTQDSSQLPQQIVEKMGLQQISSPGEIRPAIREIMAANPKQVEAYQAGKEALFGFFVGQVMKHFHGKANPEVVNALLKEELGQ